MNLEELARNTFGDLSATETRLTREAPDGMVWYGSGTDAEASHNQPVNAKVYHWEKERCIRGKLISWLLTDREALKYVHVSGLGLAAAWIDGRLDLSYSIIPVPLRLLRCYIAGEIAISFTDIRALYLTGSWTKQVSGNRLVVRGELAFDGGFRAKGVSLDGAQVAGSVSLSEGNLFGRGGAALSANAAKVDGSLFLQHGFTAIGEVNLVGANIGGYLQCGGGNFRNPSAIALNAAGAKIARTVFLNENFNAEGEVDLVGTEIGRDLDCGRGYFWNPGREAFVAAQANVAGNMIFMSSKIAGFVDLRRAKVGGAINFESARFISGCKSVREGKVGVKARFATAEGTFDWRSVIGTPSTQLDLSHARVGVLMDDEMSWPSDGNLTVDGFVYGSIGERCPKDANSRLRWLSKQNEYRPQPYQQLAKVLRDTGRPTDATRILIEKENARRRLLGSRLLRYIDSPPREDSNQGTGDGRNCAFRLWVQDLFRWFLSWALWTVGYGYQPLRAIWFIAVLVVTGSLLFKWGYDAGVIIPSTEKGYHQPFNSIVYSLQTSLPIIDLYQSKYWLPDPTVAKPRLVPLVPIWPTLLPSHQFGPSFAIYLRIYFWCHILLAWFFDGMLLAGLAGLVKKD